jgi:predicted NUDIX family phosphoesterase
MTQQKIGVGTALSQIQKYFKKIKKIGSYVSPKTNQEVSIYDDLAGGIAFEVDHQQSCVGITVHVSGEVPGIIYNSVFGEVNYL